jgi:hypothetical protein
MSKNVVMQERAMIKISLFFVSFTWKSDILALINLSFRRNLPISM